MWRTQKYRSLIKTETGNRAARFRVTGHYLRSVFTSTTATLALTQFVLPTAHAGASFSNGALPDWLTTDPLTIGFAGLTAVTITAVLWAARLSRASKNLSADWSRRLTMMEAKLEKTDAVLAAHPGLVLVWEDDHQAIDSGWGDPRILGGPAAMASLLSFSSPQPDREAPIPQKNESPVAHLLETLGDLPVEDDAEETKNLREKIHDLRAHGVSFSGAIVTLEGRAIEADGRVAGSQVTLWLTDPAARMAEDDGVMGKVRERTIDLHGALSLLEKSLMPAWRRDSDYRLAWVNRAYCEAVECKYPGEVIRKQIELDPAALKIAREAGETRRRAEGQIVVNIAGERRVLRIIETPMHSGEGPRSAGSLWTGRIWTGRGETLATIWKPIVASLMKFHLPSPCLMPTRHWRITIRPFRTYGHWKMLPWPGGQPTPNFSTIWTIAANCRSAVTTTRLGGKANWHSTRKIWQNPAVNAAALCPTSYGIYQTEEQYVCLADAIL